MHENFRLLYMKLHHYWLSKISHMMHCSTFLMSVKHIRKFKMYFCGVQKWNKTLKKKLIKEVKYLCIYKEN
jgi:hypothetical protein